MTKASAAEIESDFERRLIPGLRYCQRVGNIMGGTTMLSLASSIDNGAFTQPRRIGCFSYGSGCCSEFFSGVVSKEGQERLRRFAIQEHLDRRYQLSLEEYDNLLVGSRAVRFGTRNATLDLGFVPQAVSVHRRETLFLVRIKEYHREYQWLS
jgi:polyketide biosynthesis 3-hydroxy-3-methylglutaryl-CoA synthase-like enzyme PksG